MKNLTKSLTIAAGSLMAFGLAAHAQVVLADFGAGANETTTGWNTGVTIAGATNLVDSNGDATAIDIAFTNWSDSTSTDTWAGRTESPSWATDNALTDRLFTSAGNAVITLSDLDVNLTYDIEFASSYPSGSSNGSQPATYELSGATGTSAPVEGFNAFTNTSLGTTVAWTAVVDATTGDLAGAEGWLGWYNVAPSATGEIIINVNADYLNNSASRGALNAMQISAVPEPATYAALLGLLALGVVMWRRRR
jgi:hypothetical protein